MLPRWHRAMRLFGQRLLELSDDGCARWQQSVEAIESDSETGAVMRDLFLESLFLATDASALLERCWAALIANRGSLLNRMLNRFLFVATLPDSRFTPLLQGEGDSAQWEHLLRVPYWPYWGPMLTVLRVHMADVVRVAPHNAAKLCALWLRTMPVELVPGHPMLWRREAAELAMAIGREVQALNAEGNYFSDGHDKHVFEAVLLASPELPDEVVALCLELAERRDLHADIRQRIDQALAKRQEERRQWLASNPERAKAPVSPHPFTAHFVIPGPMGRAVTWCLTFRGPASIRGLSRRSPKLGRTPPWKCCWLSASKRPNMKITPRDRARIAVLITGRTVNRRSGAAAHFCSFFGMPQSRDFPSFSS